VHPHILCKLKLLLWMQLIAINRLTALIYIQLWLCLVERRNSFSPKDGL